MNSKVCGCFIMKYLVQYALFRLIYELVEMTVA